MIEPIDNLKRGLLGGSMNPHCCRKILHEEDTHPKTFIRALKRVDGDLFTTSVCPSVYGWQVVVKRSLVPSLAHKVFQK